MVILPSTMTWARDRPGFNDRRAEASNPTRGWPLDLFAFNSGTGDALYLGNFVVRKVEGPIPPEWRAEPDNGHGPKCLTRMSIHSSGLPS